MWLEPGDVPTDLALLPPRAARRGRPVLAAAVLDRQGAPRLGLYDASTGAQVRALSGPTGPVRSLSFSSDGRWLVSAAEDQIVSLWNVADLEASRERLKRLEGVELKLDDNGLTVESVADSAAVPGNALRVGDRIAGLVEAGQERRFDSPVGLVQAILAHEPGQTLTLRRQRPGADPADVNLKLAQAIDERKPAASLFLATAAGGADPTPRWVAWTPLGNYDLSDLAAENLLGWHFNTGRPEAPTSFAVAANYRKSRCAGLLDEVILGGPRPPPPPPPPPRAESVARSARPAGS